MNDLCPKSVYKDDRHEWSYIDIERRAVPRAVLRVSVCTQCRKALLQQLTSCGDVAGDVWETIAVGELK